MKESRLGSSSQLPSLYLHHISTYLSLQPSSWEDEGQGKAGFFFQSLGLDSCLLWEFC